MNQLYPLMLKLDGKKIVIVGGGKVAERKAAGLLATGAKIIVISPEITENLSEHAVNGTIAWQQKFFSEEDIVDAFMIFAATNNQEINQSVKLAARDHQLVTIVDDPDGSDFHVPASLHRGDLTIAVSTGGASPTLASQIREQLGRQFGESYQEFIEFLSAKREWILREVTDPHVKKQLLAAIARPEFLDSEHREEDFHRLYEQMKEAGT